MKKVFVLAFAAALFFTACNDAGTNTADTTKGDSDTAMTQEDKEERNKKIALESVNAVTSGNIDEGLKNVAADGVDYGDGSMSPVKGVDSIRAHLKDYFASFNSKGSNLEAVADGNKVYVSGEWTYTWAKDFMGAKANNKSVTYRDVDIFEFNDEGKMTSHRQIVPWSYSMQAMGVPMPK